MVDADKTQEKPTFKGSVRELKKEDVEDLRPILATWIKDRDTGKPLPNEVEEDLQVILDSVHGKNERSYLVAESEDGKIIGVVGMKTPDPRMIQYASTSKPTELVNAYVKLDERKGKGVGRALVKALEQRAREQGFKEILLNSGPRYKDTGWGFYDKLEGYNRVGVAKGYYGTDGDAPVWRRIL